MRIAHAAGGAADPRGFHAVLAGVALALMVGCTVREASAPTPDAGASGTSATLGTVEGEVAFVGAECADTPAATVPPCSGPYPAYEVAVLAGQEETEVARAVTDAQGRFTLRLPAGDYRIRLPAGMPPAAPAETRFHVDADATVRLELAVDTGVR